MAIIRESRVFETSKSYNQNGEVSDLEQQRRFYDRGFYRRFRRLRWLFRYDCRYRLFLMEETFRKHQIPFDAQKVFELGFGTGDLLFRFDGSCSLHGCEASIQAIQVIQQDPRLQRYKETCFLPCNQDGSIRIHSNEYDVVIASHVLEHIPRDDRALEHLAAHTRIGGVGLFFLPLERPGHLPVKHVRTYTAAGFVRLLRKTGWEPVEVSENFRYDSHWVQVVDFPSRRQVPVLGITVETIKNILLSLPPTNVIHLVEKPLALLHVAPRQLMVLARRFS